MANANKVPPHNKEAEQSVLGSILIDKDAIIKIVDLINPDDFYYDTHKMIYEAMIDLYNRHDPIDLLTLANLLEERKQIDTIGGPAYLAELTSTVPTASHVFKYAQIVKNKATLRKMIKAGSVITGCGYSEEDNIESLLETAEKEVFGISQTFLKDRFIHIRDILNKRFEEFSALHTADEKDKVKGIPTGYKSLDNLLSGLQPADLVIIAARPSMGKTALALSIVQKVAIEASKKRTVGIFSLEMSREQLVDRMFCSILGVDSWKLQHGHLDEKDFQNMGSVMDILDKAPVYIDDSVGTSIAELRAKARRLQMEHGLDLIIVDYLQLMSTGQTAYIGNRVQEISEISRALKSLGRELHIPVIAISQLSRAVELRNPKIPQLSDLRESGSIEQDADVVMMLYRKDYYEENLTDEEKGITEVFVRKHRNGPVGTAELRFDKTQMKFYDIDRAHSYETQT
ncbi:replicative DNA helicase [Patescibacteria group bacterium]|nr:replicative DNA helicase [Patescibacteria group bacterium]MBU1682936.1 replicative DNA helicase [Patescibacteria group bacterium]MBU1934502.1 replicative DNA helicase [Patescibacteria group bacterium]